VRQFSMGVIYKDLKTTRRIFMPTRRATIPLPTLNCCTTKTHAHNHK
jgi:hypothetical protein